jgi:GTP cyclohydrolase I
MAKSGFSPKSNGRFSENGNGHGHDSDGRDHEGNGAAHDEEVNVHVHGETDLDAQLRDEQFLKRFELNFPPVDREVIMTAVRNILFAVGEDPDREGLLATPKRVAGAYEELLSGYRMDPAEVINNAVFDVEYDDMVIVRDIEYFSLCEHHMLPFMGHAHVAYIPSGRVIGLSKIPRIVDMFSRRLQVQERLTRQIAEFIETVLGAKGVAVMMDGVHMCSMISGMSTSVFLGAFKTDRILRQEFMAHVQRAGGDKSLM